MTRPSSLLPSPSRISALDKTLRSTWAEDVESLLRESARVAEKETGVSDVGVVPSQGGVWDALSVPQKLRSIAKRICRSPAVSRADLMQLVSCAEEIAPESQRIVELLWLADKPNARNPTLPEVISCVAERVLNGKPLEFFASVCLSKGPGFREGKLAWFLDGRRLPHARGVGV